LPTIYNLKAPIVTYLRRIKSMRARLFAAILVVAFAGEMRAQSTDDVDGAQLQLNTITTAVPFLIINPETRGGGMGDVGVATSADGASLHWNPSKLAFIDNKLGASISYTPWLRALVPDISLSYLSFYYKIDRMSTAALSLRYFSLGSIQFTDVNGANTIQFSPNEWSLSGGYARKLSDRFSGGLAAKFINSNLTGGQTVGSATSKPGRTVAVDLSVYYENDDISVGEKDAEIAWGVAISNLGAKISYTDAASRDFLPINLRLGPRFTYHFDDYNKLSFALDFNKYLVPTYPKYAIDTATGSPLEDENGDKVIASGKNPDRPVPAAVFSSFYDAPGILIDNGDGTYDVKGGTVFLEELSEINIGFGAEYWYDEQFAFRAGYFWEHYNKGNRKFLTVGAGLRLNVFSLDFSYLVPTYFGRSQVAQTSPLANTLRFTLSFNFDELSKKEETPE